MRAKNRPQLSKMWNRRWLFLEREPMWTNSRPTGKARLTADEGKGKSDRGNKFSGEERRTRARERKRGNPKTSQNEPNKTKDFSQRRQERVVDTAKVQERASNALWVIRRAGVRCSASKPGQHMPAVLLCVSVLFCVPFCFFCFFACRACLPAQQKKHQIQGAFQLARQNAMV